MREYMTVEACSIQNFDSAVNQALQSGWQLEGQVQHDFQPYIRVGMTRLCQAKVEMEVRSEMILGHGPGEAVVSLRGDDVSKVLALLKHVCTDKTPKLS